MRVWKIILIIIGITLLVTFVWGAYKGYENYQWKKDGGYCDTQCIKMGYADGNYISDFPIGKIRECECLNYKGDK